MSSGCLSSERATEYGGQADVCNVAASRSMNLCKQGYTETTRERTGKTAVVAAGDGAGVEEGSRVGERGGGSVKRVYLGGRARPG